MKMQTFKEKITKINRIQLTSNIIVLIIFVFLTGSILSFVNAQGNEILEVQMAIHAVEQADYSGEYFNNNYPGVKLSILWEILYDQNIPQEELESRIHILEERLNNPVPVTTGKVPEREIPGIENTPVVGVISSTPSPDVPTTNPSQAESTNPSTNTPVFTITNSVTNTRTTATFTPSNSPTRTLTSTNTVSPTLTFTRTKTNTPTKTNSWTSIPTLTFTPTRTNTPTHTFTWVPTQTYTFTPIPPTFTSTLTNTPTFTPTDIWTNTPTPTPTPTLTPTQTYTFTPIPPTLTFTPTPTLTYTPSPTATATEPACNTTNPPITITVIFNPISDSTNVNVNIHPSVRFNQSMDATSFEYENKDSIVLCEFDHSNTCPTAKIVDATIIFDSIVYFQDTVIIIPDAKLEEETKYTIFAGTLLEPHPACQIYTNPILTNFVSSFTTIAD